MKREEGPSELGSELDLSHSEGTTNLDSQSSLKFDSQSVVSTSTPDPN